MPNIFDQFDTPAVTPQETNPFDAFDGNVFDQFDEPVPLKSANLPGSIKLNPLQQVQMQSLSAGKGIDPENAGVTLASLLRGTDDVFLQSVAPPIVAAAHALADNAVTRKIGIGLNFAGQAIKGDVESALFSLLGQNELANQELTATAANMNPAWKQKDESLGIDTSDPYEDARNTLPVAERMASGIGPGLLQSVPQLVLAALQPELGAASFGFTPQGFDPVQAAAMMVAPGAGKLVGGMAENLAAKAGVNDAQALGVINRLGGSTGVASLISAPTAFQIAHMKPGPERDEAIQDATSNAILTGILGSIGVAEQGSARPADADGALLQPYGIGGGHHIPAKIAFNGAPLYNSKWAPAIPLAELRRLGVDHNAISGTQKTLYQEFAKTGKTLTWNDIERIETQALIDGKMNRKMAEATVRNAMRMLKKSGVTGPIKVPWGK